MKVDNSSNNSSTKASSLSNSSIQEAIHNTSLWDRLTALDALSSGSSLLLLQANSLPMAASSSSNSPSAQQLASHTGSLDTNRSPHRHLPTTSQGV